LIRFAPCRIGLYNEYSSINFLFEEYEEDGDGGGGEEDEGWIVRAGDGGEGDIVEISEECRRFFKKRTSTALKVVKFNADVKKAGGVKAFLLVRECEAERDEFDNFTFSHKERDESTSYYKLVQGEGDEEGTFGYTTLNRIRAKAY